ncbi:MAG: AMP-binding protein [Myxococcota bacterium]
MTVDPAGLRERVAPTVAHCASLGEALDDALVQHKSLTALIEADRKREASRWSYLDVARAVRQVARRLEAQGIGPDRRVAVLMGNQPRWLVTAAAVFRRGAVLVPLDPKLEPAEQQALLAHCQADLLVVDHALWRKLPDPPPCWVVDAPPDADVVRWDDLPDLPEDGPPAVPRTRDDLACIVYSSGTGGRAKGCQLSHGAYLAQLDALLKRFPMAPGDRYFSVLPTNHAIDFMVGFVGPFVCGATVVHQRTLRPELLRFTMQRYRVTHMAVVPMLLAAFDRAVQERLDGLPSWQRGVADALVGLNARLTERRPRHALSSRLLAPIHAAFGGHLRLVFCGGAATDRALVERFAALGLPVVVGYGLTEACTVVTVNGTQPVRGDSVGAPVDGVTVRIDRPDADGVGEVLVAGPTLMRGYLDDPELTAETIRDGWLHTGDLGWVDASGHLHLVGRSKDVIVTAGGKNVYPEDVAFAFRELDGAEELEVFAAHTLWPARSLEGEALVLVVRADDVGDLLPRIAARNRGLAGYKRVSGVLPWSAAFPGPRRFKVKRRELAAAIGQSAGREAVLPLGGG